LAPPHDPLGLKRIAVVDVQKAAGLVEPFSGDARSLGAVSFDEICQEDAEFFGVWTKKYGRFYGWFSTWFGGNGLPPVDTGFCPPCCRGLPPVGLSRGQYLPPVKAHLREPEEDRGPVGSLPVATHLLELPHLLQPAERVPGLPFGDPGLGGVGVDSSPGVAAELVRMVCNGEEDEASAERGLGVLEDPAHGLNAHATTAS
jgi:hypothetical protein